MTDSKLVIPLESNPIIFTELAHNLGLSPLLQFHDVYSLTDPDLLSFLPQPIYGIILLFPLTEKYETYKQSQDSNKPIYGNENKEIQWFKQTISNGCGLYALLHILTNLSTDLILKNSKIEMISNTISNSNLSIDEESKIIEQLENSIKLDENFGEKGSTEIPQEVNLHFITFVKSKKNNHLYELDGRRNGPIDLGESNEDSIIYDEKITKKIQFYIDNADEENKHNFAIMAVGPSLD